MNQTQKKLALSILVILITLNCSIAQRIFTSRKDVFEAKEIVFYGYDYTGFKMADAKRIDQDLVKLIFSWIGYCQQHITEKKLRSWLGKEKVIFDFEATTDLNRILKSENLGAVTKHTIPKDSLPFFIRRYKLNEREGIGFVVILECFDKYNKTCYAYYTFFDVASRKILLNTRVSSKDGNSYNRARDWGGALVIAFKKFLKAYENNQKDLAVDK